MDPLISGALYFGRGKQQVGVLIELSKSNEIELGDEAAVAKSRNAVWPSIQKGELQKDATTKIFRTRF